MPLQLGDASHSRGHVINYDPNILEQCCEARIKAEELKKQGFVERTQTPHGEIVLDPPARDPNRGLFRILSESGDDLVTWDRRDPTQVREAYAKYNELIKKGYRAYATNSAGKRSHRIDAFDPSLEEIILVPSTIPG